MPNNSEIVEKIAVIGTGNYGIAIGKRLIDYGFEVIFGSRRVSYEYVKECIGDDYNSNLYSVVEIHTAFAKSDRIVFLAISS